MIREVIAHESLGRREETCQFGCTHQVLRVRTHTLAIVETREVPNLYLAAYGHCETSTGYRAVDQFGTEWFRDWEGCHSDGMYGHHVRRGPGASPRPPTPGGPAVAMTAGSRFRSRLRPQCNHARELLGCERIGAAVLQTAGGPRVEGESAVL